MSEEKNNNSKNYIDFKIIISAIISVLLGAAFILTLINFGMETQRRIDDNNAKKDEANKIFSVIGVDYDDTTYSYLTLAKNNVHNHLFETLDINDNLNSYVIDSKDKLDSVLSAISSLSDNKPIEYHVDEDFFLSGSIILVNAEHTELKNLEVTGISRDEQYNIQIDLKKTVGNDQNATMTLVGRAILIKIQNIQPKSVEVNL